MPVVKRTGETVTFAWTYPVSQEGFLDSFQLEKGPSVTGPWEIVNTVFPNVRSIIRAAEAAFFRLASVKGVLKAYTAEVVEVVIDDTPPPATDFNGS